MKVYTIGFTKKSAKQFFELLKLHKINKLFDIRLNNSSQLAGFTKGEDLKFFLKEIGDIEYTHLIELAPVREILDGYKKKALDWERYEKLYMDLLESRNINTTSRDMMDAEADRICLLCSEATPEKCHRRLAAEFLKKKHPEKQIEIIHL